VAVQAVFLTRRWLLLEIGDDSKTPMNGGKGVQVSLMLEVTEAMSQDWMVIGQDTIKRHLLVPARTIPPDLVVL
jgi:hypothetical protein